MRGKKILVWDKDLSEKNEKEKSYDAAIEWKSIELTRANKPLRKVPQKQPHHKKKRTKK